MSICLLCKLYQSNFKIPFHVPFSLELTKILITEDLAGHFLKAYDVFPEIEKMGVISETKQNLTWEFWFI